MAGMEEGRKREKEESEDMQKRNDGGPADE